MKKEDAGLEKSSLVIATPMYGGQCSGQYTMSMLNMVSKCSEEGIPFGTRLIFNESLVTRARNVLVGMFLESGFDHLLFVDSDISFRPEDVVEMMDVMRSRRDIGLLCGSYPMKKIDWREVRESVYEGRAEKDPEELARWGSNYALNLSQSSKYVDEDTPVEVAEAGTGFMMVRREDLLALQEAHPELSYRSDHGDGKQLTAFFTSGVDEESKRYLSEDWMFCRRMSKIGRKTFVLPKVLLSHHGSYMFEGSKGVLEKTLSRKGKV